MRQHRRTKIVATTPTNVGFAIAAGCLTGLIRFGLLALASTLLGVPGNIFWFVVVALLLTGFRMEVK